MYKTFLTLCLLVCCFYGIGQQKQDKPPIDYIIINDYLSERNLLLLPPHPIDYNKGIYDSLRHSRIEFYDNGRLVEEKHYSRGGTLYHSKKNLYDAKNRVIKSIKIDEYADDTCFTTYAYNDSLDFTLQKKIIDECKHDTVEINYTYNAKGEKNQILIFENGKFYSKDIIQDISQNERRVKSYNQDNKLSTYTYKYNENDEMIYRKMNGWDWVKKGEYFKVTEEVECIYKYDEYGNWIERTEQKYCPKKKETPSKPKGSQKPQPPKIVKDNNDDCYPQILEKLIRRIFYKQP